MQMPWQGLQGFSGAVAVGGLSITSLFLLAAVFAPNLLLAIDVVSRSTAWAIVVAIPLTSLAYVVGLLTSAAAESILLRAGRLRAIDLSAELQLVSRLHDVVISRYLQQRQEAEVLAGSALALCLLGLTSAIAAYSIDGWRRTLISITVACFTLSIGSALLSVYRYGSASSLATPARHS